MANIIVTIEHDIVNGWDWLENEVKALVSNFENLGHSTVINTVYVEPSTLKEVDVAPEQTTHINSEPAAITIPAAG